MSLKRKNSEEIIEEEILEIGESAKRIKQEEITDEKEEIIQEKSVENENKVIKEMKIIEAIFVIKYGKYYYVKKLAEELYVFPEVIYVEEKIDEPKKKQKGRFIFEFEKEKEKDPIVEKFIKEYNISGFTSDIKTEIVWKEGLERTEKRIYKIKLSKYSNSKIYQGEVLFELDKLVMIGKENLLKYGGRNVEEYFNKKCVNQEKIIRKRKIDDLLRNTKKVKISGEEVDYLEKEFEEGNVKKVKEMVVQNIIRNQVEEFAEKLRKEGFYIVINPKNSEVSVNRERYIRKFNDKCYYTIEERDEKDKVYIKKAWQEIEEERLKIKGKKYVTTIEIDVILEEKKMIFKI